jgi:hypothetical protein
MRICKLIDINDFFLSYIMKEIENISPYVSTNTCGFLEELEITWARFPTDNLSFSHACFYN